MSPLRTIGAVGDIHGEDVRLAAALGFLEESGVERIVAVGDVVDGFGDVTRCCRLLWEHQVEVVLGNHDRWLLGDATLRATTATPEQTLVREFLESLPATRSYDTVAGRLLLCHGLGENDMNRLMPDDAGYALETNDELQAFLAAKEHRFVVGGHTHHRMVKDFGGVTVINVGTLFREHDPCFCRIDFSEREVVFYSLIDAAQISESSRHPL